MKIAMIGHKDFPSRSGGVEVVVYELSTRLAARGHEVTVYNRGRQKGHNAYLEQNVRVKRIFTFKKQILNAMVYSFLATFDTIFHDFDVIHYHAIGPSVPLFLAKLFGKHTVCTVHGLNWRSDKWGGFASFYLRLGEKVAARFADEVIVLSEEEKQYFLQKYNRDSILIHNAVERITPVPCNVIREKYGLEKDSYILYVGRISPEKGPPGFAGGVSEAPAAGTLGIGWPDPGNGIWKRNAPQNRCRPEGDPYRPGAGTRAR